MRVEVAPDRCAVRERRIGVLAANHKIRETVVLAVDSVHQSLFGPAVEHLDVEWYHLEYVRDIVTSRVPKCFVLVALAQQLQVVQCPVAAHPHSGVYVIALEFAHQRIQHGAGKVPFSRQPLDTGHQRVFMRAV